MSFNGLLLLMAGFVGGLFASKHKFADYDSTMSKFKKAGKWVKDKCTSNTKKEKEATDAKN